MDDDRAAIIAVLNRYADACDTRDWALFERVFTPDVTSDYGPGYQRADRATSSCRVRAYRCGTGSEADLFYECFARYEDELARTAEGWRITHRRMRVEFELGTRAVLKPSPVV